MRTIHAILALEHPLFSELLAVNLSHEPDMRIVARVVGEVKVAEELRDLLDNDEFDVDDPVIVVMSTDESEEISPTISRLLGEFPEIIIVGICWATARVRTFQLQIDVHEIPCELDGLIEAIRDCAGRTLP